MLHPSKFIAGSFFATGIHKIRLKDGTEVQIVNVHLRPGVYLEGKFGPFSMMETQDIRLQEMMFILENCDLTITTILLVFFGFLVFVKRC